MVGAGYGWALTTFQDRGWVGEILSRCHFATSPLPTRRRAGAAAYFSWVEIELKVLLSFVPMPFTTAMIAMEMPAAIRPYSIAVAPRTSLSGTL